jgi:uncharacterized protein (UPF0332 family)
LWKIVYLYALFKMVNDGWLMMNTLSNIEQQEEIRQSAYAEAVRYMSNAADTLQKADKEDNFYNDRKYVRTACGTAYNGALIALDAYLVARGIEQKKGRKSIEYYTANIGKYDKKLLNNLNSVYTILHLAGYYDGTQDARAVQSGFENAYEIIDKIKPEIPDADLQAYLAEYQKQKASWWKRIYSFLF